MTQFKKRWNEKEMDIIYMDNLTWKTFEIEDYNKLIL